MKDDFQKMKMKRKIKNKKSADIPTVAPHGGEEVKKEQIFKIFTLNKLLNRPSVLLIQVKA